MAMHTGGRLFGPHRDQLRLLKPIYLPSGLQIPAAGLQRGPTVSLLAKRTHAGHANCDHDHHGHHHHHAHRHHDRMSGAGTPKGAEAVPELAKSAPAGSSAAPPADAGAAPELTVQGAFKYASDLVRRADYDHYLLSLLQPSPASRLAYVTLRAFNVELAQVRDAVTNPIIGKMRMQFWRDAVDECYRGLPRRTPVAVALGEVLGTTPLSKLWFSRIINEREANLEVEQYITVKDMEKYCENTLSALLYLHLDSLGVKNTMADHAASHLGKAAGISTLLRGTPYQAKERRVYLPGEILTKHDVSQEDLFRSGPDAKGLSDAVFDVATIAHDHLLTAKKMMESPEFPKRALPALLTMIPTENFLKTLEEVNFNIYDSRLHQRSWKWPAQLWWRARKLL